MSILSLPNESLYHVFQYHNSLELCSLRSTSSTFNQMIDQSLWKNLVIAQKGRAFTASIITEWRNFLSADQVLTSFFHQLYVKSPKVRAITLVCLDDGTLKVSYLEKHDYYIRLSSEAITSLKSNSCLDYALWCECLKNIFHTLISKKWQFQHRFNFSIKPEVISNLPIAWNHPDIKMKALVKKYAIEDLFILSKEDAAITASERLSAYEVQVATIDREEIKLAQNMVLIDIYIANCILTKNPRNAILSLILIKLRDPESSMREYLTSFDPSNPIRNILELFNN